MNTRIRHISRRRKGLSVQDELVTDKSSISVGRATDQDIFLSDLGVAYKHARITLSANGQIGISSISAAGLYINGKFLQSGVLKNSGSFQIGPYDIHIKKDSDGFDFDISIEKIAQDIVEKQSESLPPMLLEETWLSRRRTSWEFFLLIMIVFLAFPLAGYFDKDFAKQARESSYIPDDSVWQSGAISTPHKHFGKQCDTCHQQAFTMVEDQACVQCHADTTVHADPELFDLHELQDVRCTSCHKEHSQTEFLVRRDQFLCSDCHKDLTARVETELDNISDFSEQHSEFKPLLFVPEEGVANGEAKQNSWLRVALGNAAVKHETGIKFPHDVHLDVNGLDSPTGSKQLQCYSCHETDVSGRYMMPLEFEQHCQECHSLSFDLNTPERELPHSNLDALSATLDEYYAYMALRGGYEDDGEVLPKVISQRRIPGKALTTSERVTALAWAKDKAADVKEEVIEFRACGLCHKVERDNNTVSGWRVPEVHISQRWFSKGAFDHVVHQSTACEDCHQASTSKVSEDVILPGIKVCRDCHGGEDSSNKLDSGCVECHVFHTPDALLLGERSANTKQ